MNLWHPFSTDWTIRFGWTVLHSLWQGALIAVALAIVLMLLRHKGPQARYVAAMIAMGLVLASAVLTFELTPGLPTQNTSIDASPPPAFAANPSSHSRTFMPNIESRPAGPQEVSVPSFPPLSAHAATWLAPALAAIAEAWAAGVLLLSFWNFGGWIAAQRLRVIGVQSPDQAISSLAQSLSHRLGIRKPVRLAISLISETPMVIGWIWPVLLLPAALLSGLTPKQIEGILAHELAHIRRHDYLINLLQVVAETLLFYHPAVWWISRRIRLEREQCCDEIAVATCGDRCAYAESLSALAELRLGSRLAPAARGSGKGELITRIRRLLRARDDASPRRGRAATAAAAWLLAALAATAGLVIHGSAATAPFIRPTSAPAKEPSGPPTVLLVTDGNYFLERAVLNLGITAATLSPAEYDQYQKLHHGDANRVTIFDRWAPSATPPGPAIYVDCIPPGSTLMAEKDDTGRFRNVKDAEVTEWLREHPILKGLDLNRVHVADALKLRVPADWESLARGKDGNLIVANRAEGKQEIVIGFNVLQSNWPFEVSFPVFLHRSVLWLAGNNDLAPDRTLRGAGLPSPRLQLRLVGGEAGTDTDDMKDPDTSQLLHVYRQVELDESDVKAARIAKSPSGQLSVEMDLTAAGSEKLAALTSANINKKLAILFDGRLLMAATIRDRISGLLPCSAVQMA